MATIGTYVAEVPLKGSAQQHYKRWKSENHLFMEAAGHHVQGVKMDHGDWESHGSVRTWNYTNDGKQQVFKEKRELDDKNMAVTLKGVGGHKMDHFKVYDLTYHFIPNSSEGCVCKVTLIWEKKNADSPEPSLKFVTSLVADMDDHVLKGQNKA